MRLILQIHHPPAVLDGVPPTGLQVVRRGEVATPSGPLPEALIKEGSSRCPPCKVAHL